SFSFSSEDTTTFQIKTTESTNQGIPFYVVIKSTTLPQFLSDDYQKVATQTMLSTPDPANLMTLCFIPGTTQTLQVKNPEHKPLAIYCIFTHPGEEWKYLVNEEKPQKVKILLGENEIKSINKF
ncbi:MAG: hypothetical protein ACRDFB_10300, partial [Rhabdochlamydiaceae bacterium]